MPGSGTPTDPARAWRSRHFPTADSALQGWPPARNRHRGLPLGDARHQGVFQRTQRRIRDGRRDVQAGDLVGRFDPPSGCHHGSGVNHFGRCDQLRNQTGEHRRQSVGADPPRLTQAGGGREGGHQVGGIPAHAIQVLVADFRRHPLVPGGEQMHPRFSSPRRRPARTVAHRIGLVGGHPTRNARRRHHRGSEHQDRGVPCRRAPLRAVVYAAEQSQHERHPRGPSFRRAHRGHAAWGSCGDTIRIVG